MPNHRPGPFGPAHALLPEGQEVLIVAAEDKCWDALERMQDAGFSPPRVNHQLEPIGPFMPTLTGQNMYMGSPQRSSGLAA
jgi:hypothetical protein